MKDIERLIINNEEIRGNPMNSLIMTVLVEMSLVVI